MSNPKKKQYDDKYYQRRVDKNEKVRRGTFKCIGCGNVFDEVTVLTGGFRLYRHHPNSCLCCECKGEDKFWFYNLNE